jgi:hypothetical protein
MDKFPAVHIAVYAGETTPAVFSTALRPSERRALEAWLAENPELDKLVRTAWRLAENEDNT